MSILNLNGPAGKPARSKRAVKVWMGIGLVIAVLGVGSTLASTITINGGPNTEFGQGVSRTVYCGGDQQVTISPISAYENSPDPVVVHSSEPSDNESAAPTTSPGKFYLGGIKISDIPDECSGVDFVLSVYPSGSANTPTIITDNGTDPRDQVIAPAIYWGKKEDNPSLDETILSLSKDGWVSPGSGSNALASVVPGIRDEKNKGSFVVTFNPANAHHADIDLIGRILIETQDDTFGKDSIHNNDGVPTNNARIHR